MPKSLRSKIKHLAYKGEFNERERDRLLGALDHEYEEKLPRYKPIILQEHDAEPRTLRAIIDTATDEIYVCKLTKQRAEFLGMTIEEVEDERETEGKEAEEGT